MFDLLLTNGGTQEGDQDKQIWSPVGDVRQEQRTEKPQTISCQLISFSFYVSLLVGVNDHTNPTHRDSKSDHYMTPALTWTVKAGVPL